VGQKFTPQSNFGLLIVDITFDNDVKIAYSSAQNNAVDAVIF